MSNSIIPASAVSTQTKRPWQVLLIGCGNIAGGFDSGRCDVEECYTHAGAFTRDGRFELAVCVDPNSERCEAFKREWHVRSAVASVPAAFAKGERFDIISICSPTAFHAEHLHAALDHGPRIIFCEKPVTASLELTEYFVRECERRKVLLAVNHTRRWDPHVRRFKQEIAEGRWGPLHAVTGIYTKGILNNGSHLIDLLHELIGPLRIINAGRARNDFWHHDPTVPVVLETSGGVPVHLVGGDARDYSMFEIQFVFARGVVAMEDGGLQWRKRHVQESPIFSGYRVLSAPVVTPGGYSRAMRAAVENLHAALANGEQLASDGASALRAQRLCTEIADRAISIHQSAHDNSKP